MESTFASQFSVLGHPQRLALLRLLIRRYPDRVPAGVLASALDLRPSTLSAYLNALMGAGLVLQERRGTSLRYAADMAGMGRMLDYLMNDCCRGRPDLCQPSRTMEGRPPMTRTPYRVLFICTGNSARSILAEAILRKLAGDRFEAHSAGTRPSSELNPFAVELLRQKGHDIAPLRAKHVSEYQGADAPVFDFVFTVCDRAANEECPPWPGLPVSGHWGLPDPVAVTGTQAEKSLAFQKTYGALFNRIRTFSALSLEALDRIALQHAVDDIAQSETGETA